MKTLLFWTTLMRAASVFLVFAFAGARNSLQAAEFFVDPLHGSMDGDGSRENPWRTLQEVVEAKLIETQKIAEHPYREGVPLIFVNKGAPVRAGDTLYLLDGYHGEFSLRGAYNDRPIVIQALEGHLPRVARVKLQAASSWVFRGLSISTSHAPEPFQVQLVDIENHNWHGESRAIVIENCEIFSVEDVSGWSEEDWLAKSCSAIAVEGDDCLVLNNRIRNVRFGISTTGARALVSGNRITNFAGDGMRGLGDYSVFEYNTVENAFKIDANHDDGFQSWSVGEGGVGTGEVRGVVLRGNTFINTRDPEQPLQTSFQGIGCFDGMYVDWVIENNVVSVNHWHGITLMGAENCIVRNNTVIDMFEGRPGPSWIRIVAHKNGTASSGNIVSSNIAHSFTIDEGSSVESGNLVVTSPEEFFVDAKNFDFRLSARSPAIDSGDGIQAVETDFTKRPRDAKPDSGAYEFFGGAVRGSLDCEIQGEAFRAKWEVESEDFQEGFAIERSIDLVNWVPVSGDAVERDLQERTFSVGLSPDKPMFFRFVGRVVDSVE